MSPARRIAALVSLVLVPVAAWSLSAREAAAESQPGKRAAFMRQKLERSKGVLQGLTLEDYPLIEREARALRKLSEAAEFEVFTLPHTDYVRFSGEFQNFASDLIKAAQAKDLDAATLAYGQLVVNCVNCHKFVRLQPKSDFKP